MTRKEFDAQFAATSSNTEGFTAAQLQELNDAVFLRVCDIDAASSEVWQAVKSAFDGEANQWVPLN